MSSPLDSALDLLRRLPTSNVSANLDTLVNLCPELAEDLVSLTDKPLEILIDDSKEGARREFLTCDYNRDGESWRSPWSSTYHPPLDDGTQPSQRLRELELRANSAFDTYRNLYFDGGLSSVYLWDLDDGFAGVVLFKKELGEAGVGTSGWWDSVHVFEVTEQSGRSAKYKVTCTIMLGLARKTGEQDALGGLDLVGSLQRQNEAEYPITDFTSHIGNMGRMIESLESSMRSNLQEVYFSKTQNIVSSLRSMESLEKARTARTLQQELMGRLKR